MRGRKAGLRAGAVRSAAVLIALGTIGTLGTIGNIACGGQPSQASSAIYTPAHRTFSSAVRDFFNARPAARQPLPFPHQTHIAKQAMCTDCHETVERGPIAGIPSVKTCMICHSQIATTKPLIKEVTAYSEKGIDIPWQRVYGFSQEAHVRFNHAPHIRAKVECAACHGE